MCIYVRTICILIMCTIKTHVKPFDKYNKCAFSLFQKLYPNAIEFYR